jgi:hypothetical protein
MLLHSAVQIDKSSSNIARNRDSFSLRYAEDHVAWWPPAKSSSHLPTISECTSHVFQQGPWIHTSAYRAFRRLQAYSANDSRLGEYVGLPGYQNTLYGSIYTLLTMSSSHNVCPRSPSYYSPTSRHYQPLPSSHDCKMRNADSQLSVRHLMCDLANGLFKCNLEEWTTQLQHEDGALSLSTELPLWDNFVVARGDSTTMSIYVLYYRLIR